MTSAPRSFTITGAASFASSTWIMTRRGVEASGREAMWNAAEPEEPRKNGQLATEFEIGPTHSARIC
jgi:hypothetical protein